MDMINGILATGISEFKKNPNAQLEMAEGKPFAVLTNNKPSFFVVPAKDFQTYLDFLFDKEVEKLAIERLKRNDGLVGVKLEDLE